MLLSHSLPGKRTQTATQREANLRRDQPTGSISYMKLCAQGLGQGVTGEPPLTEGSGEAVVVQLVDI